VASFGQNAQLSPLVPSPSRSRIYPTSADLKCRTRASPSSVRERAQWCARDREGVRGFRRHPSPIIAGGGTELPSPARGEGTITATEFAARRRTVLVVHLTMSNSHIFSFPRVFAHGLASFSPTEQRGGRSAERRIFFIFVAPFGASEPRG
jgi:hypothetical protein